MRLKYGEIHHPYIMYPYIAALCVSWSSRLKAWQMAHQGIVGRGSLQVSKNIQMAQNCIEISGHILKYSKWISCLWSLCSFDESIWDIVGHAETGTAATAPRGTSAHLWGYRASAIRAGPLLQIISTWLEVGTSCTPRIPRNGAWLHPSQQNCMESVEELERPPNEEAHLPSRWAPETAVMSGDM